MRSVIANKDNETVESVREATNNLQKAAMKLFEFAYKNKVSSHSIYLLVIANNTSLQ